MPDTVIEVEHLSKYYRLGLIGGGTLREDVDRLLARIRGKPDPTHKIGLQEHPDSAGKEIWALRDVNLEVKEGEILGIIGRNGAGKSTLLKILSRITAPTEGSVKLRGRVGSLLEVGTGFHPELTGRENIYLNGTILGMNRAEVAKMFDEIVDFSGVEQFVDTPVKRYSSGMIVRLAFAVAAHLESEILIVDEVLAVGDVSFQRKCLGKMSDVSVDGRTVLFVSHSMVSIKSLCHRGILLDAGQVVCNDEVDAVISLYLNSEQYSQPNIEHAGDRTGNGKIRIRDIKVRGGAGQSRIGVGEKMELMLRVESNGHLDSPNVIAAVTIRNSFEAPVFHTSSEVTGELLVIPPNSTGQIVLELPQIMLLPGTYSLEVRLRAHGEVFDHLPRAVDLTIVEEDFYGSGMLPPSRVSMMVMNANWTWKAHLH